MAILSVMVIAQVVGFFVHPDTKLVFSEWAYISISGVAGAVKAGGKLAEKWKS